MYTAIYARQSLDKKDSLSIEGQVDLCRAEATGEFKVYTDKGFSGKNTHRPSFAKLIKDVESGEVEKLVCYRLDRISRSIMDFGMIWETLNQNHVEFVSINEKFDTSTPVGRAMLYIIMVFAQLERETIAERVRDNYYQRVKKGAWPGGPAPFGFQIAQERVNGQKSLEPTPVIETVKHIFNMYAEAGTSLGKIAKALTEEGIPCARRTGWDGVSVGRILRNPAYAKATEAVYAYYKAKGAIIYNDASEFTGKFASIMIGKRTSNERKYTNMQEHLLAISFHKGVIEGEQFLTCQFRMDNNRQIKNTGKGKLTWLSGLLHCAECGYSLRVIEDKQYNRKYLSCAGRSNLHICSIVHSERIEDVEAMVESVLMKRFAKQQAFPPAETHSPKPQDRWVNELGQIENKISNLIQALADGNDVSKQYINAAIQKLDDEKQAILSRIETVANTPSAEAIAYDFSSLDFETKKKTAAAVIKNVLCAPSGIEVKLR
ncbi:recombinase family protein [Oscillibacter sp.]|uniref:recombinase family protein n=1 Tax=Oscillibacter sp. TaxID=1945593 RepID=UPI00289E3FEF|nr:recombinase family protein [Oscillibacter sp.]